MSKFATYFIYLLFHGLYTVELLFYCSTLVKLGYNCDVFILLKKLLLRIPIVRRTNEFAKYIRNMQQLEKHLITQHHKFNQQLQRFQESNIDQAKALNDVTSIVETLQLNFDMQLQQINSISKSLPPDNREHSKEGFLFADNHALDMFYAKFEDRFRGSEEDIKNRVSEYLPLFKQQNVNYNKYPVLDIGSGRGEFLQVLKEANLSAIGLDINYDMVKRSRAKGLKTKQGNAVEFLSKSDAQKYGAITGFHIVEHLPFNVLLELLRSSYNTLVPGGLVLFETPNPENVTVGSCTFYMDPSHLSPIPPALLAFALETVGFQNIEVRKLHPVADAPKIANQSLHEIANRFYGALDYAVIGYKPKI